MGGQETAQVGGVDVNPVVIAHDANGGLGVTSGDAEAAILIVYETVKRYFAQRTQITADIRCLLQDPEPFRTNGEMGILRDSIYGLVERGVLTGVPIHGFTVHVSHVPETPPREEILFHIADKAFHLSLCEGMTRLTEFRLKTNRVHECLIILVPDRITLKIAVPYDALHVVCEHIGRNAHIPEAVKHPDEQALLSGIGEEFHEHRTAVMTYHRETGHGGLLPIMILSLNKAPIHLESFARLRSKSAATVPLRRHYLPFGWNQITM